MVKLKLNTIQDVNDFVTITTSLAHDIRAKQGRYVVDAKSIMGIFALSHLIPFEVESDTYDENTLKEKFERFIWKEE